VIFPLIPGETEGAAEIDLLNPNVRSTAVELKLWSVGGQQLARQSIQLPAGSFYRNLPRESFRWDGLLQRFAHHRDLQAVECVFAGSDVHRHEPVRRILLCRTDGRFHRPRGSKRPPVHANPQCWSDPYFRTGRNHASTLSLASIEAAPVDVDLTAIGNQGETLGTRRVTLPPTVDFAPAFRMFSHCSIRASARGGS